MSACLKVERQIGLRLGIVRLKLHRLHERQARFSDTAGAQVGVAEVIKEHGVCGTALLRLLKVIHRFGKVGPRASQQSEAMVGGTF
ncbi:hypothetical protein D9M69_711030 [compost metagenome]